MSDNRGSEIDVQLATMAQAQCVRRIEDEAGRLYATAGLPDDLPGLTESSVKEAQSRERLWVAVTKSDVVGFALAWDRPRALHLRELSVAMAWMRQGIGRRLVESVAAEAKAIGLPRVTLTTFRDVAWNAPLYRRWGFEPYTDGEAWMQRIFDDEHDLGLDAWPRIAMVRRL